jgi:hypothetical protein
MFSFPYQDACFPYHTLSSHAACQLERSVNTVSSRKSQTDQVSIPAMHTLGATKVFCPKYREPVVRYSPLDRPQSVVAATLMDRSSPG